MDVDKTRVLLSDGSGNSNKQVTAVTAVVAQGATPRLILHLRAFVDQRGCRCLPFVRGANEDPMNTYPPLYS